MLKVTLPINPSVFKVKELEIDLKAGKQLYGHQVFNDGEFYIYEITLKDGTDIYPKYSYEAFKKKTELINDFMRGRDTKGKYNGFTHFVRYPSTEEFGFWASCHSTMKSALEWVEKTKTTPDDNDEVS